MQTEKTLLCSYWRTVAVIIIASWVIVIGVFWDTAASMAITWYRSRTFSHGFLILPVSLYLIWSRRRHILPLVPTPNLWALPVLATLGFGWFLGNLTNLLVVQQLAVVAMLPGLVWLVTGAAVTRTVLFPLAFLFFAVPMGENLMPPLQDFTAFFTVTALQLSGIPVFWEGRVFPIPSGTWYVAEACSGVRYLISLVALGCLYAVVTYQSWIRRLGFILASVAVPIVANGVRVYGIVSLTYISNNTLAIDLGHQFGGTLFFGMIMFLLFWLGLRWREPGGNKEPSRSSDLQSFPTIGRGRGRAGATQAMALTAAGGIAMLALAPLSAQALSNQAPTPVVLHAAVPEVTLPWRMLDEPTANWGPRFRVADTEVMQSYTAGNRPVDLYIAYYARQHQGAELFSSKNRIVGGKQWARIAESYRDVVCDGRLLRAHESIIRSHHETRLVWKWYWVAGEFTSSPYYAKLLAAKTRLFDGPQDAAVIALSTDHDGHLPKAIHTLQDFLWHTSFLATLDSFSKGKRGAGGQEEAPP